MVSLKLAEPLVEAVKAKLQANLAARIAAINADTTLPAIAPVLQVPANSDFYTSGLSLMPQHHPSFVIAEGPMQVDRGTEGPHSFVTDTELAVYILEADPDRQVLGKRLTRQARAIIEALWDAAPQEKLNKADGQTLLAYRIFPLRTVPGPVYDPGQQIDMYRGWYQVVFIAQQFEGA